MARPLTAPAIGRRLLLGGTMASLAAAGALGGTLRLPRLALPEAPPPVIRLASAPPPVPPPAMPGLVPLDPSPAARLAWAEFRRRFVAADGRVVDTGNGGVSHSEGQGWGLLLAAAFEDFDAFTRIADFTRTHLRRPEDALHAWCWRGGAQPVPDWNNASDGDLYIAAGLARGAALWGRADWAIEAGRIAADLLRLCTREVAGRLLLLPGSYGFETDAGIVVNPSYYAFGLLPDLACVCPSAAWARLARDGAALIGAGRFGAWQLPPDWLFVSASGRLSPASGRPPRFSYDAIRVPLHLVWGGLDAGLLAGPLAQLCGGDARQAAPAWVDLATGERAAYRASPGMEAIIRMACRCAPHNIRNPTLDPRSDYYSSGLLMLCLMAQNEGDSRSVRIGGAAGTTGGGS